MVGSPLRLRCHRRLATTVSVALVTFSCLMPAARVSAAPALASYTHAESGFTVTAPRGWRRVRDGEMTLPAGAAAGFVDSRVDVVIYVVVEFIPGGVIAQDDRALDRYTKGVTTKPGLTAVFDAPVPRVVAGRRALRSEATLTVDDLPLVNTVTFAREGYYYFTVGSIAEVRDRRRAAAAHTSFERGVTISRTSDDVIAAIASPLAASLPYLDVEDVRFLMRAVLERLKSQSYTDAATLGFTIVVKGRERLPAAERERFDFLHTTALTSLSDEDFAFLERTRASVAAGRPVSREDRERMLRTLRRAFTVLTPAEVATVGRIARESIRLGIEAYDASP